jgi:hypothetical protein
LSITRAVLGGVRAAHSARCPGSQLTTTLTRTCAAPLPTW